MNNHLNNLYTLHIMPYVHMTKEKIEQEGMKLPKKYEKIAQLAGVKNIDKIKVLYSDTIEFSFEEIFAQYMPNVALSIGQINGLTLGYHILINKHASKWTLVHELRHVAQYELFEDIDQFIQIYIKEFIEYGYKSAPFEKDAIDFVNDIKMNTHLNTEFD